MILTVAWTPWRACPGRCKRGASWLNAPFITPILHDDFAGNHIRTQVVDQSFPFLHPSRLWALASFMIYYWIAIPVVFLICKLYLGLKFENHRQLRRLRTLGYFLYGNHTQYLDAFLPAMAPFPSAAMSSPIRRRVDPRSAQPGSAHRLHSGPF